MVLNYIYDNFKTPGLWPTGMLYILETASATKIKDCAWGVEFFDEEKYELINNIYIEISKYTE